MRRWLSIARATALEILSEPLSLLVTLSALVLAVLTPAFHYHQFGEATRMARDAGFSALLVGGALIAVFGTIKSYRREIESGTLEMALARPVSRSCIFLAKAIGAAVAYSVFAIIVFSTAMVTVEGAAIGGFLAERSGDIAKIWGPCLAVGVSVMLLPLVVGAAMNRFRNARFCLSAFLTALVLSAVALAGVAVLNHALVLAYLPAALLICVFTLVLLAAAAAFSMRFRTNAAASFTGLVLAAMLPFAGNYYLAEALANGGGIAWSYVLLACVPAFVAAASFLLIPEITSWTARSSS